jgi:glycosyltransferase involved in cell wall biosynthesis
MSSGKPLVTIVVVAYNNWPDLELAIQSALCQSHRNVEVIVVDNSSTDDTPREVSRLFGDRVRYVRQTNRRDSGAYNTGAELAAGEFVQFVDGDDLLAPTKLEKQLALFTGDNGVDIAFSDVRCFQTMAGPAGGWIESAPRDEKDLLSRFLRPRGAWMIPLVGMLFRKSAVERIGRFDEDLYNADVDYVLRALWTGCVLRHCPGTPLAFYRFRPGQMTTNVVAMARGREAVWRKSLDYIDREPYHSLARARLAWEEYVAAVSMLGLTRREAFAKLREGRAVSPETVSLGALALGTALIAIPGASRAARAKGITRLRQFVSRRVGPADA